jgi:membrane fusion protein (multidrug efflux system)
LESGYGESVANLKLSQSELARTDRLFREKLISQQEFDQAVTRAESDGAVAELRKRQLADAEVTAPFAGVVGGRNVSPGQVITRDETLTWLVDLDPVKVKFNVPERFLRVAKKGLAVSIGVAAFPDRAFEGQVYFVAPFVDSNTRNIEVKATVPNLDRSLIPGMFANIELTLTIRQQALVIPEMAIFRTLENDEAMVYIVGPGNVAEMKTISIGERMPGKVEVLTGLEEGDLVIVEGTQKIGPGAPVTISGGQEGVPGA